MRGSAGKRGGEGQWGKAEGPFISDIQSGREASKSESGVP